MIVMHAAVTLVTAVALRHADRAVAGLAATLRRVLPLRLSCRPTGRFPPWAVPCSVVPTRLACAFVVTHVRHGPSVRR